MTNNIELASYYEKGVKKKITVENYMQLISKKDKAGIADFLYHRLYGRYIKPFSFSDDLYRKEFKNGFSLIANACLLIETLQAFKNGWADTENSSRRCFESFFKQNLNFVSLRAFDGEFYENVRCGILHQGETRGGWRLTRLGSTVFNRDSKLINANKFMDELHKSLKSYCKELQETDWENRLWNNFRKKMESIISNCKVKV